VDAQLQGDYSVPVDRRILFQLYPSHMTQNIPQLLPLMLRVI
jgi:hypothetical protein